MHELRLPLPAGCPVSGCRRRIAPRALMCRRHWRRVPMHLRSAVLRARRAWRALVRAGGPDDSPEHLTAWDRRLATEWRAVHAAGGERPA